MKLKRITSYIIAPLVLAGAVGAQEKPVLDTWNKICTSETQQEAMKEIYRFADSQGDRSGRANVPELESSIHNLENSLPGYIDSAHGDRDGYATPDEINNFRAKSRASEGMKALKYLSANIEYVDLWGELFSLESDQTNPHWSDGNGITSEILIREKAVAIDSRVNREGSYRIAGYANPSTMENVLKGMKDGAMILSDVEGNQDWHISEKEFKSSIMNRPPKDHNGINPAFKAFLDLYRNYIGDFK